MNNQYGGYISSSHISNIIRELSNKYNQTPDSKRNINSSITNTGHGSIFLGSSAGYKGGDRNIRMLIGAHFSGGETVGIFGGKCDKGERTIDTVIRETIEEIFNFQPTPLIIREIRNFLNINTELYFIFKISERTNAYSYIFDVSILGNFIEIINNISIVEATVYYIPTNTSNININEYYEPNIKFSDLSSFNGVNPSIGIGSTIKLSKFLKERFVSRSKLRYSQPGLNEIKYLSFASLGNLISSALTNGIYNIYVFGTNERRSLRMQDFFIRLLQKDIIIEILSYSI